MSWEFGIHTHTLLYPGDNRQGPSVEHRELYSVLCDSLRGERVWERRNTRLCVCAQSLQSCLTLQPCGLQPARLICPWDSSGKSAGGGATPTSRGSSRPGTEPVILRVLHGQVVSLPLVLPGKPKHTCPYNMAQPRCCIPETDTVL